MPNPPKAPPLDWTDADLDALTQITPADVKAAQARWRAAAPPWAKALLDAMPEDVGG